MKSFYLIASTASFLFPTASCSNPTVHSGRPRRNSSHPQPGRAGMVVFPLGHLIEVRFVFLPLVSGSMARRLIRVCGAKVTLLSSFFYQPVYILPPPVWHKRDKLPYKLARPEASKTGFGSGFRPFPPTSVRPPSDVRPFPARGAPGGGRPPSPPCLPGPAAGPSARRGRLAPLGAPGCSQALETSSLRARGKTLRSGQKTSAEKNIFLCGRNPLPPRSKSLRSAVFFRRLFGLSQGVGNQWFEKF